MIAFTLLCLLCLLLCCYELLCRRAQVPAVCYVWVCVYMCIIMNSRLQWNTRVSICALRCAVMCLIISEASMSSWARVCVSVYIRSISHVRTTGHKHAYELHASAECSSICQLLAYDYVAAMFIHCYLAESALYLTRKGA